MTGFRKKGSFASSSSGTVFGSNFNPGEAAWGHPMQGLGERAQLSGEALGARGPSP